MTDDQTINTLKAAWHLCQSLLADRDGATQELVRSVSEALEREILRLSGRRP